MEGSFLALPLKFVLAFVLGAVMGIEREINHLKSTPTSDKPVAIIGLRTFAFTSVLGLIVVLLYDRFTGLSLIVAGAFFVLLAIYYVIDSMSTKDIGITTEIAMIYAFLIGILIGTEIIPVQLTLAVSVIFILLLSQKEQIKQAVDDISKREINAFISYAIIALVILPFLPNKSYSFSDIPHLVDILKNAGVEEGTLLHIDLINPFKLWLIVALITGVDMLGYILERFIGHRKGWILASMIGGFVSSTATTQSLAQQSTQSKTVYHLLAAAILANLVSFIQVFLLIGPLNGVLLARIIPSLFCMLLMSLIITYYFYTREKKHLEHTVDESAHKKDIFNFSSAFKFASLFILISIVSKVALTFFGQGGFLAATALGAFVGLDAIMVNTAQLAGRTISYDLGVVAFILANAVNLIAKSGYTFLQGKREFAVRFTISTLVIIVSSLLPLLFF